KAVPLNFKGGGGAKEALAWVDWILAMSRNLKSHALTESYPYGGFWKQKALSAWARWLAARRSPELLRRAVTMLANHEAKIPPVSLSVLTEDIRMRRVLASGPLFQRDKPDGAEPTSDSERLSGLWSAPWRHSRHPPSL